MREVINTLPLFLLIFIGISLLSLEIFSKKREFSINYITSGISLIVISILSLFISLYHKVSSIPSIFALFNFDKFTYIFWSIITFFGGLSLLVSGEHLSKEGKERSEFYPIFIFTIVGTMLFIGSNSTLLLYLGLEIMSLGSYILVIFRKNDKKGVEAGLKYFLIGAFSSAIFLYGLSILYGLSGSLNLSEIKRYIESTTFITKHGLIYLSLFLILTGILIKVGAVPFHFWCPDLYQGAPIGVTIFLIVVVKSAVIGVMIRFLNILFGNIWISSPPLGWALIIWSISILTMTIGNLLAIKQRELKRLLGFSSISHLGYMLIGILSAYKFTSSQELSSTTKLKLIEGPISSILFYLIAYGSSMVLALSILSLFSDKNGEHTDLEDIKGLWKRKPSLAFLMTVSMLSLLGIPIFSGFFAKFYLFKWGIETDILYLVIIALINTVISAYYYLKVVVYIYMKKGEKKSNPISLMNFTGLTIFISAFLTILLGIFPESLLKLFKELF